MSRAVIYTGPPLRSRANDTTAPWLGIRMADAGYTAVRERLGLPTLGDMRHTEAERLWELYRDCEDWDTAVTTWRGEATR